MSRQERAFTLVEILVVLVIAGFLTAIALPRLAGLVRSIERDSQRRTILGQVEGLGYLAYSTGRPIRLFSSSSAREGDPVRDFPPLPDGWRMEVAKTIVVAANGMCGSGRIVIVDPEGDRRAYELTAPLCRLVAIESDGQG